jgi:hypothetical protein
MVQDGCEQQAAIIKARNTEKEHPNRLLNSRLVSTPKAGGRLQEGAGEQHSEDL